MKTLKALDEFLAQLLEEPLVRLAVLVGVISLVVKLFNLLDKLM